MATSAITDLHPHIIQTHILPRLDGPSLSSTASSSSYLRELCAHENLWSQICISTWPSTTDARLNDIISTFPAGHRSFFQNCFPALVTNVNNNNSISCSTSQQDSSPCLPFPSQLISAVDIHYENRSIYSKVEFTDITSDFLSSALRIILNDDLTRNRSASKHGPIDLKVDEVAGANNAALFHLKESLTLKWIIIHPTRKRAGNISSIKPVIARRDWMTNETHLIYVTVLPGCDLNKMVQYRIQVVLGVCAGGVGLYVKEVMLELMDLEFWRLTGRNFLVITQGALSEESNVRRKIVDDEEHGRNYRDLIRTKARSFDFQSDATISSHCVLQISFCFFKAKCHVNIGLITFQLLLCITFVVISMIF